MSLKGGCQGPGQQFIDAADGMFGDLGEHGAEVEFRVEPVELGRADGRVDVGGALATAVGAGKQEVLPLMPRFA